MTSEAEVSSSEKPWFDDYAANTTTERISHVIGHAPTCVADFVQAWLMDGHGVYHCRTYRRLMFFTVQITRLLEIKPYLLDYREEKVRGKPTHHPRRFEFDFFYGSTESDHPILNPRFFNACAQAYKKRQGSGGSQQPTSRSPRRPGKRR